MTSKRTEPEIVALDRKALAEIIQHLESEQPRVEDCRTILAVIASFLVGIESTMFGFLLLPVLIVSAAIIILGYSKK